MKRIITIIAAATFVFLPMAVHATTESIDMCFTIYEDAGQSGDRWQVCDPPSLMHISDLSHYTNNLTNGCHSKYAFRSGWNDCASPNAHIEGLPANYRLVMYYGANYSGGRVGCDSVNGNTWPGFVDDEMSSWRVEGGDC